MSAIAGRYRPAARQDSTPAEVAARLVDGLCHDSRTPLAIVAEFASIISEDLGPDAPSDILDFLWTIGQRVREVEGLLADFALADRLLRRGEESVEPIDVGSTLAEVEPGLGALSKAFGKKVDWEGLTPGLRTAIRAGDLVRAVNALIDSLYRMPGTTICARLWHAGAAEVGGTIVIECFTEDVASAGPGAEWSPASPEQMGFRYEAAAAIVAHYGGRLDLMDGAEHRACRIVLPAVPPSENRPAAPAPDTGKDTS